MAGNEGGFRADGDYFTAPRVRNGGAWTRWRDLSLFGATAHALLLVSLELTMIAIKRILCPVDFSDHSRRALDHAFAIAKWYGSSVTVMHVFPLVAVAPYGAGPGVFEPLILAPVDRRELLSQVERFATAESAPGVPIDCRVQEGNAAPEILALASEIGADLIVIGTHGRSGFERFLLGSVAEKVLRKAACPVLTVPRATADAVPATPVLFKEILCPIDFSESSLQALRYAVSIAEEADARLTVLHVLTHDDEAIDAPDAVEYEGMTVADYRDRREQDVRAKLEAVLPNDVREYCTVEPLVIEGKPWREILRVAAERRSELIVIGVQGRGAVDLLFFGSNTQHVVREATCPVLTLRRTT